MGARAVIAFFLTALLTILLVLPTGPAHRALLEYPATTPMPVWLTERVDAPKVFREMSDHSLAIDTAGRAHIAYGADLLYYATYDGSAWQVQTVDDSGYVGQYAALTLGAADQPHISYYDVSLGTLKYAYFDGRWWHIFTLDSGLGQAGGYTSLALTTEGQPSISYYDGTNAALKYAIRTGSAWITETVDTDLGIYHYDRGRTSLALDAANRPHIAYYDDTNASIKYAHHDGTAWRIESIDSTGLSGNPPSLAVDSSGRPHISYCDGFDVKYASYNGVFWQSEVVATGIGYQCMSSLTLDHSDHPHIAVFVGSYYSPNPLYYAYYDGITWIVQLVADGSYVYGSYPAIALDSAGQPRISYLDDAEELRYASAEQGFWQIQRVDRPGYVGGYASSAIDSYGRPHIAYCSFGLHQYSCRALKYAHYDGTAWLTETVMTGNGIGEHASLALDAADQPHISFCEGTADHCYYLRYAHRDVGGWHVGYVDTTGQVGDYTSITLDSADRPHIAYQAYSHSPPDGLLHGQGYIDLDLKYAYFDGATWQLEIVDTAGYAGYFSSLTLDSQDHPHIAYYTSNPLYSVKYAHHNGTSWQIQVVGGGSGFTTLALDAAGRPHIAYANGGVYYAYHDGTSWNLEPVVSGSYYPHSLVLDAAGRPHISYTLWRESEQDMELGYAYYEGTAWQTETIESYGMCGWEGTMRLGIDAQPQMAYFDGTKGTNAGIGWLNSDLKYAYRVDCTPPQGIQLAGPTHLATQELGVYTATVAPVTATRPLITWDNGISGLTAGYFWDTPGTYTITTIVTNGCGQGSTALSITVCQEVESVAISGVTRLYVGQAETYTASASPPGAAPAFTWSNGNTRPATTLIGRVIMYQACSPILCRGQSPKVYRPWSPKVYQ